MIRIDCAANEKKWNITNKKNTHWARIYGVLAWGTARWYCKTVMRNRRTHNIKRSIKFFKERKHQIHIRQRGNKNCSAFTLHIRLLGQALIMIIVFALRLPIYRLLNPHSPIPKVSPVQSNCHTILLQRGRCRPLKIIMNDREHTLDDERAFSNAVSCVCVLHPQQFHLAAIIVFVVYNWDKYRKMNTTINFLQTWHFLFSRI